MQLSFEFQYCYTIGREVVHDRFAMFKLMDAVGCQEHVLEKAGLKHELFQFANIRENNQLFILKERQHDLRHLGRGDHDQDIQQTQGVTIPS